MLSSRVTIHTNPSATGGLLVGDSVKRYSLTVWPSPTATVYLSNDPIGAAGLGIALLPGQAPVILCVRDVGDCVQRAWYAWYSGTLDPVCYIEALD